jgi:hypothetical protein
VIVPLRVSAEVEWNPVWRPVEDTDPEEHDALYRVGQENSAWMELYCVTESSVSSRPHAETTRCDARGRNHSGRSTHAKGDQ